MSFYLVSVRMAGMEKTNNNKYWQRYGEKVNTCILLAGRQNNAAIMKTSKFLKKLKNSITLWHKQSHYKVYIQRKGHQYTEELPALLYSLQHYSQQSM